MQNRIFQITIVASCILVASSVSAQMTSQLDTNGFRMTKSPAEAVCFSLVPGGGQLYLDQPWKLPIIYGLLGGFLYGAVTQNVAFHTTTDQINSYLTQRTFTDSLKAEQLVSTREYYRDDCDRWWIYLGITYVAQLLDAYIAAHLYDFDVSNTRASQFQSYYDPMNGHKGITYILRF
jgi:hypothetical protein